MGDSEDVQPPITYLTRNPLIQGEGTQFVLANPASVNAVTIQIFDLAGDLVTTLSSTQNVSELTWDGNNRRGKYVGSGLYIYVVIVYRNNGLIDKAKGTIGVIR